MLARPILCQPQQNFVEPLGELGQAVDCKLFGKRVFVNGDLSNMCVAIPLPTPIASVKDIGLSFIGRAGFSFINASVALGRPASAKVTPAKPTALITVAAMVALDSGFNVQPYLTCH